MNSHIAKAIIAAVVSATVSGLGVAGQAVQNGGWNSASTIALITGVIVSVSTTFGVYQTANQ